MAETSREIGSEIKSAGKQALETGKDIYGNARSEVKSRLSDAKSELKSSWGDRYETVRGQAQDVLDTSVKFTQERPLTALLGACAVGFVAGMILRRSRD
jgi:ElaB/YqjD/DUF883 family membrane-anchored ribosome-binding protein